LVTALFHGKAVEFIDPRTLQVIDHLDLSGAAVSISVSPDGERIYVGLQDWHRVVVISVKERKVLRDIRTPEGSFPDPAWERP
jgi:DNA-binding beta-propeller fold protein YncE